jgi:hypothetical protein
MVKRTKRTTLGAFERQGSNYLSRRDVSNVYSFGIPLMGAQ